MLNSKVALFLALAAVSKTTRVSARQAGLGSSHSKLRGSQDDPTKDFGIDTNEESYIGIATAREEKIVESYSDKKDGAEIQNVISTLHNDPSFEGRTKNHQNTESNAMEGGPKHDSKEEQSRYRKRQQQKQETHTPTVNQKANQYTDSGRRVKTSLEALEKAIEMVGKGYSKESLHIRYLDSTEPTSTNKK